MFLQNVYNFKNWMNENPCRLIRHVFFQWYVRRGAFNSTLGACSFKRHVNSCSPTSATPTSGDSDHDESLYLHHLHDREDINLPCDPEDAEGMVIPIDRKINVLSVHTNTRGSRANKPHACLYCEKSYV